MGFKSDIEIAQETPMEQITVIADKLGIEDRYLEQYGKYKAKIDYNLLKETKAEDGKLILVTAINPTPAGEGKTTTSVGLADGLSRIGKKVCVALRVRPWDRFSALRAAQPAAAMPRWYRWRISTFILPVTFMRSAPQTICLRP